MYALALIESNVGNHEDWKMHNFSHKDNRKLFVPQLNNSKNHKTIEDEEGMLLLQASHLLTWPTWEAISWWLKHGKFIQKGSLLTY